MARGVKIFNFYFLCKKVKIKKTFTSYINRKVENEIENHNNNNDENKIEKKISKIINIYIKFQLNVRNRKKKKKKPLFKYENHWLLIMLIRRDINEI